MKKEEILEGSIYLDKLMGIQVKVYHCLGTDCSGRQQGSVSTYQVINKYHIADYSDIDDGDRVTFRVEQPLSGWGPYCFGVTQTTLRCTILTITHNGVTRNTQDKEMNIYPDRLKADVVINLDKFQSGCQTSFVGKEKGRSIRSMLALNRIDEDRRLYEFVIPVSIASIDFWFFSGLFKESIQTLGERGFDNKYSFKFETLDKKKRNTLQKSIDEHINLILIQISASKNKQYA